jgi:hypothetical protein
MSEVFDVFNEDPFTVVSLTAAANRLPFVPGQVTASGLFEEDGVPTTTILVEELNGSLSMIAPSPRGGEGESVAQDKRSMRSFVIPHFQRDDAVMADEVQGVRMLGTANALETVQNRVDVKMGRHFRDLDTTLEHQRVGAIKGVITDKNGVTMFNLFTEYGISAPGDISFALTNDATKVRQTCLTVILTIEDALEASTYSGIRGYCGKTFWSNLIENKSVKDTYLNTIQAQELRGDPSGKTFEFGGITFERYRTGAKASAANAGAAPFVADTECRFVVEGVAGLFLTRFAPADYEETVNTIGLPRYAKQYPMLNDKGRMLEMQSNPINICTQPKTLLRGVAT